MAFSLSALTSPPNSPLTLRLLCDLCGKSYLSSVSVPSVLIPISSLPNSPSLGIPSSSAPSQICHLDLSAAHFAARSGETSAPNPAASTLKLSPHCHLFSGKYFFSIAAITT